MTTTPESAAPLTAPRTTPWTACAPAPFQAIRLVATAITACARRECSMMRMRGLTALEEPSDRSG